MNLTQLSKAVRRYHKKAKRRGCGDSCGHGGTSCRGGKGQSARSGYKRRGYFEGGQMTLVRKTPKRGFHNTRFQETVAIINLRDLNRFEPDATVNQAALVEKGILKGAFDKIKVLAKGELEKQGLTVEVHYFSESAKKKIEAKGGKVITCKE
ncbi:MAG: 50S ribosomal protein L15 [Planctomycetes bacterium]|nr:50S ribosomal protein L15 [Planctomycetota bacterium]